MNYDENWNRIYTLEDIRGIPKEDISLEEIPKRFQKLLKGYVNCQALEWVEFDLEHHAQEFAKWDKVSVPELLKIVDILMKKCELL